MDNRKVAANDVVGPCVFRNRPDKPIVIQQCSLVQKGSEELVNNNERACIHVYH